MKEWIKEHKITVAVMILFIMVMVIVTFVFDIAVAKRGNPVYGTRLNNIKTIEITKTNINNLIKELKEEEKVIDITHSLSGKLNKVIIKLKTETSSQEAKVLGTKVLSYFDKEQLDNYSFEIYLVKEETEDEKFPIIGHKNPNKSDISWTKER